MKSSTVNIVVAAYNAESYVKQCVQSVFDQDYPHWHLFLVDDGSTDQTYQIMLTCTEDPRVTVLRQKNGGVSSARNQALALIKSGYLCFLDADDVLPAKALSGRVKLLDLHPEVDYVDGIVIYTDEALSPNGEIYQPRFKGYPKSKLLKLSRDCLFGNTWMIRLRQGVVYQFDESLSHTEDLYFYLSICHQSEGLYTFIPEPVLYYRRTHSSAMTNLTGLEMGYAQLLVKIKSHRMASYILYQTLKLKVVKIMFLSHLLDGKDAKRAFHSIFRLMRK